MKKYNAYVLSCLMSCMIAAPLYAEDAPDCPPLDGYSISLVTDRFGLWEAFFQNGPSPMYNGLISTTADNREDAKSIATYAMFFSKPAGKAHKVTWPDGSWFWACSSLFYRNYSLVPGAMDIFIASSEYSDTHNLMIKNQHTVKEQYEKVGLLHTKVI